MRLKFKRLAMVENKKLAAAFAKEDERKASKEHTIAGATPGTVTKTEEESVCASRNTGQKN